jgi:Tol biopolymer transport system component
MGVHVFVLALVGCDGAGVTDPFGRIGLHIAAGGDGRDTVMARLATPLVVQYRDARGEGRSGVTVRLEAASFGAPGPHVVVSPVSEVDAFRTVVTDTTDAGGRVAARVAFGPAAGRGWIRVTAPGLGLADSASYEVLAGAATRLAVGPSDTALHVGATVQLRAKTLDRWGNARSDVVRWSAVPGVVETSETGLVRGQSLGRATARASASGLSESVALSVVPPGVIAAVFFPIAVGEPEPILVFNTDGSGLRRIDVNADCMHGLQWSPAGDRLLFGRNPSPGICFTQRLYAATLAGTVNKIRPDTVPLSGEFWPRLTADEQWVYFTGRPGHQNGEIWRVRPDGSGAERVGPSADFYDLDQHPSPSPAGTEVVYVSNRDGHVSLRVLDVSTRVSRDLGVPGHSPSWSPRGDLIAFLRDDRYYVMTPDGTGERSLIESRYSAGMPDPASWSPDGRWIVVVAADPSAYAPLYGKLVLVEVESGMALPLGWTAQLTYPTWRRADN